METKKIKTTMSALYDIGIGVFSGGLSGGLVSGFTTKNFDCMVFASIIGSMIIGGALMLIGKSKR